MTLAEQLLATRQARIERTIEEQAPKAWRAGRVTRDGETTVTSKPYSAEEPPEHKKLLEDNGYDPERFKIVGPIRQTSWTSFLPKEYRTNSVEGEPVEDAFTFQAKAYRFQVVERGEGELSIDELVEVVSNHQPQEPSLDAPLGLTAPLDPALPYVVAVGDTQIGKELDSPTEELLQRVMDLLTEAARPVERSIQASGVKFKHIHLPWLGDCIEGMNSQGGRLRWRTRLTITEQVRILRRLMLFQVELFAPLADRVTILSVPGNHDEANTRDLDTRMDDSWAVEALNQVSDALSYNEAAFGHVECYVPGEDGQGVVLEVGDTIVAHIHGHTFRQGQHFKWWAGQTFGGQDYGKATLLLQGHQHHFQVDEDGFRKWVCVPAVERESIWWKQKTGTGGSPGLVTFQVDGGALLNLNKLEPKGVA